MTQTEIAVANVKAELAALRRARDTVEAFEAEARQRLEALARERRDGSA